MNAEFVLKRVDETLVAMARFLQTDSRFEIVSAEEIDKLETQKTNLDNLARKLRTGELEVAVVGLEKAGKSMFSSAFAGKPGLFPSADERCTFTSTALRHGDNDMARVEFYSAREFKETFEKMLQELKFPHGKFEGITAEVFNQHFESLKETDNAVWATHVSKTETDIKDIIEGREKIRHYLGSPEKTFTDLAATELSLFITDKHVSRAVKNVTFYSCQLDGLENIILYDVPGFDSPTQVHLEQTTRKLQDVDAIVMVKNIKRPSLTGNEVDILVRNSDMDGIRLHEKMFVFGSYADSVHNLAALHKNMDTLVGDLSNKLKTSFDKCRLFTGCLDLKFENALKEMGSHTQLEELKNALREYNKNERALVLEKRINRAIEEVKTLFKNVVQRHQLENNDPSYKKIGLATDLLDKARRGLANSLARYINPVKREIIEGRKFTQSIIEKVDACIPELDAERIENSVHRIQSPDARNTVNYSELNRELRKDLTQDIKASFVNLVLSISRSEAKSIEAAIADLLLNNLGVEKTHPRYTFLAQKVNDFVEANTQAVAIRDTAFKPLIERFTVDLIDTMIAQPLGENARKERFLRGKTDLYMLSLFSAQHGLDIPYRSALVSAVLTQQWASVSEHSEVLAHAEAIRKVMPRSGASSSGATQQIVVNVATILAETVFARGLPVARVVDLMKGISQNIPAGASAEDILLAVVQGVRGELGQNTETSQLETNYIEQLLAKVKQSNTEEAVLAEIKVDLSNLLSLFKDSVVSAMNLELPFVGAITLYVDTLNNAVEGEAFRLFIANHVSEILYGDFQSIDNDQSRREIRVRMLDMLNDLLKKLELGAV